MWLITRVAVAAWAMLLCAAVADPASAREPGALEAYFDTLERDGFSGTILAARDGEVVTRAFGMADAEWGIPNTVDTRFRIGSLTKQFTAAAILLLAEDGKLALEDSVCRHVDPCPTAWQPITLRMLLDHSSGITDVVRMPGMDFRRETKLSDTIERLRSAPLDFPPGSEARYGNSGFLISAAIIEKVSGQPYAEFLNDRIYARLAMADSGYAYDAAIIPRRAHGYVRRDGKLLNAPFIDMSIPIGAGSQYSTVTDLYRWDRALANGTILSRESLAEAFPASVEEGFGLGWEIGRERGRRVIEHNGDINGFGAFIARYPDEDGTIVVLTNIERTPVRTIKEEIAARLFAD